MNDKLKAAARAGDIDLLYALIQVDPYLLERLDLIPFVDSPLHVAVSLGHTSFATEIIRLKPSFAWKLNQHGFSPMHLALHNEQYRIVSRFIDIDKDLVRVKGREGLTPLHFVTQIGKIDLVAKFLSSCPGSIEDVTVRSETALHIAVKYRQLKALQVLVGWLQRTCQRRALDQEKQILNWEDEAGNTILHLSALENFPQAVGLLIDSNIDLNAKNLDQLTVLDIVEDQTQLYSPEMKNMLLRAGALRGLSVAAAPPLAEEELRSKITFNERVAICVTRLRRNVSNDTRNALLVVAILFATSTYEAALSPPGGVYQAESSVEPITRTSSKLAASATPEIAGEVVMKYQSFVWFWLFNTSAFYLSILMICLLMPRGRVSVLVTSPLVLFSGCFVCSMVVITPCSLKLTIATAVLPCILIAFYCWGTSIYIRVCEKLRRHSPKQREDRSKFSGGNKW